MAVVQSTMLRAAQPCRLLTGPQRSARRSQRAQLIARAQQQQQGSDAPAAAAAAAAEQHAAVAQSFADTAEQQQQQSEDVAVAYSDADMSAEEEAEQQEVWQAVPPPATPEPRGLGGGGLPINLQHPAVKVAGISAAVFLGGTLLIALWKVARDPQRKRGKTINKNKAVIDTISKYLPGNRAGLNSGAFTLLKLQTGFSNVEVFRKYLWYLLRERQFDEEALGDLVALKAALGLSDEQVAEALKERAQRVYEKYGTVMVNLEGMSQAGIERKAASRNLFIKLLSLTESRQLLSAEAAGEVDLGKIFGATQRDILTLRSGYSAEAEGGEQAGEGNPGDE